MSPISRNIWCIVSAIILGCFLVGVQPREISRTEHKTNRDEWENRGTLLRKEALVEQLYDRYLADSGRNEYTGAAGDRGPSVRRQALVKDLYDLVQLREVTEERQPRFDRKIYTFSLPEDTPVGTTIGHVQATDGTDGEMVYSFGSRTNAAFRQMFHIDEKTGNIILTRRVDYEKNTMFPLSVTAGNEEQNSLPAEAKVKIMISDVNDNAPDITINTLTGSDEAEVEENAVPGTFVAHISVYDPDSGDNGRFSCVLDDDHFRLAQLYDTEFKIVTARVFDREMQAQYNLIIKCQDSGAEPRTSTKQLTVNIEDVNDNVPVFDKAVYTASITENNIVGLSVLRVQAADADTGYNADIHYALDPAAEGYFKIDPVSGLISTEALLDHEETPELTFNVIASDKGNPPMISRAQVKVTITDMNDNEPVFDQQSYLFAIPENVAVGTTIGRVHATDEDSGPYGEIVYSQTQTNFGRLFHIDAETGEIIVKSPVDFEDQSVFDLSVMAKNPDEDSLPAEVMVKIMIVDNNDNTPDITINALPTSGEAQIRENTEPGTFVAHISVYDPDSGDNGRFSCVLDDDHFRLAQLYDTEFKIVTARVFDREMQAQYNLIIKCQDSGAEPRTSTKQLTVNIEDVNDNVPVFDKAVYTASITENNIVGLSVLRVQAADADTGYNADIHYALDPAAEGYFKIDPVSGLISTEAVLDDEQTLELTFNVIASDKGSPPRISHAQVKVTITDMNDNEPVFDQQSYLFAIPENVTVGTTIGRVHAMDKDSGPYGEIVYSQTQTRSGRLFHIDAETGEIIVKNPVDFEDQSVFDLSVMAKNPDEDSLPAEVTVKIMILDVNDNTPEIQINTLIGSDEAEVQEDAVPGTFVAHISVYDPDSGDNGRFSCVLDDDHFRLVQLYDTEFKIVTTADFDGEMKAENQVKYKLTIQCEDNGKETRTATRQLTVTVVD